MSNIILPDWIKEEFPLVTSVSLGKCGATGRKGPDGVNAHVHHLLPGVVCYFNMKTWSISAPSRTFLHEYAHLKAPPTYNRRWSTHHRAWKAELARLLADWYGEIHHVSSLRARGNGKSSGLGSFIRNTPIRKSTGGKLDERLLVATPYLQR